MKEDAIRKMLREVAASVPDNEKGELESVLINLLRDRLVHHVQTSIVTLSEDVGLNPLEVSIKLTPLVAAGLLRSVLINVAANTTEDNFGVLDDTTDQLREYINDACFSKDSRSLWKDTHMSMLRRALDGGMTTRKRPH